MFELCWVIPRSGFYAWLSSIRVSQENEMGHNIPKEGIYPHLDQTGLSLGAWKSPRQVCNTLTSRIIKKENYNHFVKKSRNFSINHDFQLFFEEPLDLCRFFLCFREEVSYIWNFSSFIVRSMHINFVSIVIKYKNMIGINPFNLSKTISFRKWFFVKWSAVITQL